MKLLLPVLLTTTALLASPVLAADLILPAADEPGVVEVSSFDWNGAYVGVNAGVAQGVFTHPYTLWEEGTDDAQEIVVEDLLYGSGDVTAGGFVGGLTAGYNVQMDNFVLGVEGDINGSSVDGRVTISLHDASDDNTIIDAGTSLDYFASLRARAGLLVTEQALLYVTGGLAVGQTTSSLNYSYDNGTDITDDGVSETSDRTGWTAGFGLEYALTDNVTLKTEYIYTDLGSATLFDDYLAGGPGGGLGATVDSEVAFHTVRAGLNFQF
jgi:outer membrane immunogenic protein